MPVRGGSGVFERGSGRRGSDSSAPSPASMVVGVEVLLFVVTFLAPFVSFRALYSAKLVVLRVSEPGRRTQPL